MLQASSCSGPCDKEDRKYAKGGPCAYERVEERQPARLIGGIMLQNFGNITYRRGVATLSWLKVAEVGEEQE